MRIAIIGNSGSGKSTLAGQVAAAHSLAALDLDTVAWEAGKVAVARPADVAAADLAAFCSGHERWVVEGGYRGLVGQALAYSPILLFMDPGVDACVANCHDRPWEPHQYATRAEQDANLEFLLSWVRGYGTRDDESSLRAHQAVFEGYRGLKLRLTHHQTTMLDDLGARFERCAIPAQEWTHAAHLVVGLWHVHRCGADDALVRLRSGIRRLNECHGGVNSETSGYHETITAVYVQLLAQFLASSRTALSLDMRALELLADPLADRDMLCTFYSRDRLGSPAARCEWVEPDLAEVNMGHMVARRAASL